MLPSYANLHPGAGAHDGLGLANGRVFSLYWSWVTRVSPNPSKDKFPKGHLYAGKPIPKRWVRCAMPWASDVYGEGVPETWWAPILTGRPTFSDAGESEDFSPKVNTPVLVGFVGNSYEYPVVLGFVSNPDNEHRTGRADLQYRVTRGGHVFVIDDEGKKKLKKLHVQSSAGHKLTMYDADQDPDDEDAMSAHNGQKRQVIFKDMLDQGLVYYCPEKPDVPVYVKLANKGETHVLHMQAEPNKFASFSDIKGQYWKFDTDAQQFFIKGNILVDIKSDKAISVVAGTTMTLTSGGPMTLTAPSISLGPGSKPVVLNGDTITGTITDSRGGACSFNLKVSSSATIVTAS